MVVWDGEDMAPLHTRQLRSHVAPKDLWVTDVVLLPNANQVTFSCPWVCELFLSRFTLVFVALTGRRVLHQQGGPLLRRAGSSRLQLPVQTPGDPSRCLSCFVSELTLLVLLLLLLCRA